MTSALASWVVLAGRQAARALLADGSLDLGAGKVPDSELYGDPDAGVELPVLA